MEFIIEINHHYLINQSSILPTFSPRIILSEMKLIAFIKGAISITKILTHLGEEVEAPKMQGARQPPEAYQVENEIEGYHEPEYHYDQTLNW